MVIAVGINRTSNASLAIIRDGVLEYFGRKERITREKHAWGRTGDLNRYLSHFGRPLRKVDVLVECFSSDPERHNRPAYEAELLYSGLVGAATVRLEISHHFAHALTALPLSGFDQAAILVADNRGSPSRLVGRTPPVLDGGLEGPLEVISSFVGTSPTALERLDMQAWNPAEHPIAGLGTFFTAASQLVFGRENTEGVLMGLAAYGDPRRIPMPELDVEGVAVRAPVEWLDLLGQDDRFSFFRRGPGAFADCADLAAVTQAAFEAALLKVAHHVRRTSGMAQLAYAGGCALNCSANGRLMAEGGFERVYIPPACDDGGTAIGCAIFGAAQLGRPAYKAGVSDFIGKDYKYAEDAVMATASARGLNVKRPAALTAELAEALSRQQTVAIFDGCSEGGPRALGHRSILADPRFDAMRYHINQQVKSRAWFRPLAPMVPFDEVGIYFDCEVASPYMQRKVDVRPEWRSRLGAVCHVDGSARIQTVREADNPWIYALLKAFGRLTGCSVILNTSFNGRDEPIVESLEDALDSFTRMPLDLLCVGSALISKPGGSCANMLLN